MNMSVFFFYLIPYLILPKPTLHTHIFSKKRKITRKEKSKLSYVHKDSIKTKVTETILQISTDESH